MPQTVYHELLEAMQKSKDQMANVNFACRQAKRSFLNTIDSMKLIDISFNSLCC